LKGEEYIVFIIIPMLSYRQLSDAREEPSNGYIFKDSMDDAANSDCW
jgi:hypothetical protein